MKPSHNNRVDCQGVLIAVFYTEYFPVKIIKSLIIFPEGNQASIFLIRHRCGSDLRGTCCSHLVMSGVDLVTVKELMGHQSLAMVLRYVGLAPNHKVKAVELLDNALGETQSIQKVYNLEI